LLEAMDLHLHIPTWATFYQDPWHEFILISKVTAY